MFLGDQAIEHRGGETIQLQRRVRVAGLFKCVRLFQEGLGERETQVAFILNSNPADTLKRLHGEFYEKNLYPELWFKWLGKPLLLAPPEAFTTDAQRAFYTARHSWAWSDPRGWFKDGRDRWCWTSRHD